jgi:XTP/dITP diphosphohydrolase
MTRLVLATKNKDKLRELQSLMKGSPVRVFSLADFPECAEVEENGRTFEANAKKKAREYSKCTRTLTLADDSGLMVSCLKGKPGVYSARFAGPGCAYQDNNLKLLSLMKNVPESRRLAKFVCVMAIYDNQKFVKAVRGECRGKIAFSAKGKNGFGYDPVFIPEGFSKTFAELSPAVKNRLSHRGKALLAAKRVILDYSIKP